MATKAKPTPQAKAESFKTFAAAGYAAAVASDNATATYDEVVAYCLREVPKARDDDDAQKKVLESLSPGFMNRWVETRPDAAKASAQAAILMAPSDFGKLDGAAKEAAGKFRKSWQDYRSQIWTRAILPRLKNPEGNGKNPRKGNKNWTEFVEAEIDRLKARHKSMTGRGEKVCTASLLDAAVTAMRNLQNI